MSGEQNAWEWIRPVVRGRDAGTGQLDHTEPAQQGAVRSQNVKKTGKGTKRGRPAGKQYDDSALVGLFGSDVRNFGSGRQVVSGRARRDYSYRTVVPQLGKRDIAKRREINFMICFCYVLCYIRNMQYKR